MLTAVKKTLNKIYRKIKIPHLSKILSPKTKSSKFSCGNIKVPSSTLRNYHENQHSVLSLHLIGQQGSVLSIRVAGVL